MSTPFDFIERVVAWPGSPNEPGYVNLHYKLANDHWAGRAFKEPRALIDYAQWASLKPELIKDIYFCLSTQRNHGGVNDKGHFKARRVLDNALNLKALWLDIDVKAEKGYATFREAIAGLTDFLQKSGLSPPSAIVVSGAGLHVYWISERPLSVDDWRPYAEGLRAEAVRLGLICDAGLTTDAVRLLRVPGTFNRKYTPAKVVKLTALGASYDFAVTFAGLKAIGDPIVTAAVTRKSPSAPTLDVAWTAAYKVPAILADLNPADSLSAGIEKRSDLPLKIDGLLKECPHFKDAAQTGGAHYPQGLWMLDVLASGWLEQPRKMAHVFSKGYTAYDKAEVDAMFDRKLEDRKRQNLGWPGCQAFENEGCKLCATCIYKGKISSPLTLAERVAPTPVDEEQLPAPIAELAKLENSTTEPDPDKYDMMLPPGYVLNREGVICQLNQPEEDTDQPEVVPLFFYPISRMMIAGGPEPSIMFKAKVGMDGWHDVRVLQKETGSENEFQKALNRQWGLVVPRNERLVRHFMRSWQQQIQQAYARVNTQPFGWVWPVEGGSKPEGFCYASKLFHLDGTVSPAGYADPSIAEAYKPQGTSENWYKVIEVITGRNHPALEVMVLAAAASPLMFTGGEKICMLWAWSPLSSAHKSTSLRTGQAIWGSPVKATLKPSTSALGLQHRLGTLRNLPVFVDEIKEPHELEQVAKMTGVLSEGGTGTKMQRSGTEERVQLQWQSILMGGSNKDIRSPLIAADKTTDAALRRIFCFEVEKRDPTPGVNGNDLTRLVASFDYNHGQLGELFAQHIAINFQRIGDEALEIEKDFMKSVDYVDSERFWLNLCVAIIEASVMMNEIMPKAYFHTEAIYAFLVKEYIRQRAYANAHTAVGGTYDGIFDELNKFLNATLDNQIWTTNMPTGRGRPAVTLLHRYRGTNEKPVYVRWVRDQRVVHISLNAFNDFIKTHDLNPAMVDNIEEKMGAKLRQKVELTAGLKGPNQAQMARETVIEIPVPEGSPFEPRLLSHAEQTTEEPGAGLPPPQGAGLVGEAVAQAASDLEVVRSQT